MQIVAPAAEKNPTAHFMHVVDDADPSSAEYVPEKQFVQAVDTVALIIALHLPAVQGEQLAAMIPA